jgi:predicted dehydrogenase
MEFPDGIVTSSATSYATNIQRLYLAADNGWLEIRPAFGYGPLAGKTHQGNLDLPIVNHQATQLDAMASCLLENLECSATGEEGIRDLRVIEAIYKSISTGRKVKI